MTTAASFLTAVIQARASRRSLAFDPCVDVDAFLKLVRQGRLEGLVYSSPLSVEDGSPVDRWFERLRPGYQQASMQAHRIATTGCDLLQSLSRQGIPCFGMRGPFDAIHLYDDPAARSYSDLDIYVPRAHAYSALALFREKGFELYHRGMPWGFFFRNHLNWTLIHREQGLMCDLHWAVDHPFQSQRLDYDAIFDRVRNCQKQAFNWPSPSPEHWLLLSACHLEKHIPNAWQSLQSGDAFETMLSGANARSWVDLALFISHHSEELDWPSIIQDAEQWQVTRALAGALEGGCLLAGMTLPTEIQSLMPEWTAGNPVNPARPIPGKARWQRWIRPISRSADFNLHRLQGAAGYASGEGKHGLWFRARACLRLAAAGIDTLLCAGVAWGRNRLQAPPHPFYVRTVSVKELR